eukprot:15437043-Alexandrium_andersonii.AAC.1
MSTPSRPRPCDSASFCVLTSTVTAKQAGGRAGVAFRRGGSGWSPPGSRDARPAVGIPQKQLLGG